MTGDVNLCPKSVQSAPINQRPQFLSVHWRLLHHRIGDGPARFARRSGNGCRDLCLLSPIKEEGVEGLVGSLQFVVVVAEFQSSGVEEHVGYPEIDGRIVRTDLCGLLELVHR